MACLLDLLTGAMRACVSSAALQPPVFGGVDPARNIHSLYKLHCVDGDANG